MIVSRVTGQNKEVKTCLSLSTSWRHMGASEGVPRSIFNLGTTCSLTAEGRAILKWINRWMGITAGLEVAGEIEPRFFGRLGCSLDTTHSTIMSF